jgi:hypothetical protein
VQEPGIPSSSPVSYRPCSKQALPHRPWHSQYEFLEAEGFEYAIRLPSNDVLQREIGLLLTRPVGRPSNAPVAWYHDFRYQAASWTCQRRVVAKVEWHKGELFPRVAFVVTNLRRSAVRVVRFYNQRGTAEQWIKEGKNAVNSSWPGGPAKGLQSHPGKD